MPPSECWLIKVLVCKVLVCEMNLLTLWPWPLTFELQNSTTSRVSQGHYLHQVRTLWDHSFLSYAPDKQTDGLERPTSSLVISCSSHSCCSNCSSSWCCGAELETALVRTAQERATLLRSAVFSGANQNVGSPRVPRMLSSHEFWRRK